MKRSKRLDAIGRAADHFHIGLRRQHRRHTREDYGVIVHQQDANAFIRHDAFQGWRM